MIKVFACRNGLNLIPHNNLLMSNKSIRLIGATSNQLKQPIRKELSDLSKSSYNDDKQKKQYNNTKKPHKLFTFSPYENKKFEPTNTSPSVELISAKIKTKLDALNILHNLSDKLINHIKSSKTLSSAKNFNYELKTFGENTEFNELRDSIKSSKSFNDFLDYVNVNFGEFITSEKSILLNILAKFVDNSKENQKLNDVLFKLECDFYDNVDKLNLIDISNYFDGFFFYRSSIVHFVSKIADPLFRLNLEVFNNHFKDATTTPSFKSFKSKRSEKLDQENKENEIKTSTDETAAINLKMEDGKLERQPEIVVLEDSQSKELSENEKLANKIVEKLNKDWLLDHFSNNLILSLDLFKKLSYAYTIGGKSYAFNYVLGEKLRYLNKNDMETIANILIVYDTQINNNHNHKINKNYLDLLVNNFLKMFENMNQINDYYLRPRVVRMLTSNSNKLNNETNSSQSEQLKYLEKYKMEMLKFFLEDLKTSKNLIEFSLTTTCITRVMKSLNQNSKAFFPLFSNSLDSVYSKIMNDFEIKEENTKKLNLNKGEKKDKLIQHENYRIIVDHFRTFRKFLNSKTAENLYFATKTDEMKRLNDEVAENLSKLIFHQCKKTETPLSSDNLRVVNMLSKDSKLYSANYDNRFLLTPDCLDKVYQMFEAKKEEGQNSKEDLLNIINILIDQQFYSSAKMKNIFMELNSIVDNNVEDIKEIIRSLVRNIDFYMENYPKETVILVQNVFKRIVSNLMSFEFNRNENNNNNNNTKVNAYVLNLISRRLLKFKNHTKFELIEDIKIENIDRFILSSSKENDTSKRVLKKNIIDVYEILKCLSNIQALCEPNSNNLLLDIMSYSTRVLHLMNDNNLFVECVSGEVLDQDNRSENFMNKRDLINLLTIFGLFNYYDIDNMTKDVLKISKLNRYRKDIETINTIVYDLIRDIAYDSLIYYNLSLINLNIENRKSLLNLFGCFRSFDDFKTKFSNLSQGKFKSLFRIFYSLNQEINIKYKHLNPVWLFDEIKPRLDNTRDQEEAYFNISSMIDKNMIKVAPIYEFNLRPNYEIAIDDQFNFVNPNSKNVKFRIPLVILNELNYISKENLKFNKPTASYINNLKKLHPTVVINSSEFNSLTNKNEKLNHFKSQIIKALEAYAAN